MLNLYKCFLMRTFGSVKQFKMPDLGEKIKEATIVKWHVKIGDEVEEFQPVADVQTDKLFTQIPSNYNGKIHQIFHKESDVCQVGELFLEIETDEADTPKTTTKHTQQQQQQPLKQQSSPPNSTGNVMIAPTARILAKQHNIDLSSIKGTGNRGVITKQDLLNAISTQQPKLQNKSTTTTSLEFEVIKMNDFQKGMQKSMTQSNTIPHLYLEDEYNLTELNLFRENLKKKQSQSITFMTFFIKAFSLALNDHPIVNSTYDETKPFEYQTHADHNISLALDSPFGLVVPNIKRVQDLSLLEIQQELFRMRDLGQKGQFSQKELFGGTVTISNIGTIGGTYTSPLILPPQICIVGVGRVITVPRLVGKQMQANKIMNVSFGCDHRILDGATVTRFSNSWKQYLEDPNQMVLKLK